MDHCLDLISLLGDRYGVFGCLWAAYQLMDGG